MITDIDEQSRMAGWLSSLYLSAEVDACMCSRMAWTRDVSQEGIFRFIDEC